jgi:3-oxoacyl-(acyl-carrier-protein) synthase
MHQSYCDSVDHFDNRYFEISNAESHSMDPVQRVVLETGAMSLAMIGLTKKESNKRSTHASFSVGNDKLDWHDVDKDHTIANFSGAANVLAIIANRFSFVFNMKGPNFVCDTACSASLVSTHLSKLMLRARDYDALDFHLSLGAHLVLAPGPFIGCSQSRMSTIKGRCFTFNSSADGYLRGEGASGIMLKFGNDVDGRDAVLRASQVGQDGRSASLTAPNGPAQEDVIVKSVREAHTSPTESTFWECHGTGTSLGDPIEVGACRKTQVREERNTVLGLCAHKTNIGHLEGGAGMAGIVKCVVQCKHSAISASNHIRTLNPHLEHTKFPAFYSAEINKSTFNKIINHVSSFGFGGTNGHAMFWGVNRYESTPDNETLFQRKMLQMPPPEVRPIGTSPDEWESDWPDTRSVRKGAKWAVSFAANDLADTSLKYVLADDGLDDLADLDDHFYCITGNFNDWQSDRLVAGDVPGLWVGEVEIPESGELSFHFLQNGLHEQALCPESPQCTRKTETIIGPSSDGPVNSWLVRGAPHQDVQIELFVQNGVRTLLWIKR